MRVTSILFTTYSEDPKYNALSLKPVYVEIIDNDITGIVLDPPQGMTVSEGIYSPLMVNLKTRPQRQSDGTPRFVTIEVSFGIVADSFS